MCDGWLVGVGVGCEVSGLGVCCVGEFCEVFGFCDLGVYVFEVLCEYCEFFVYGGGCCGLVVCMGEYCGVGVFCCEFV